MVSKPFWGVENVGVGKENDYVVEFGDGHGEGWELWDGTGAGRLKWCCCEDSSPH